MTTKTTSATAPKKPAAKKPVLKRATDAELNHLFGKQASEFVGPLLPGLPAPKKVKARQAEPLTLSSKSAHINTSAMYAAKLQGLQAQISALQPTQAPKVTKPHASHQYNRPQKPGDCLTIWQWLDANSTATRKQCQAWGELNGINPITCGVQYGHWVKAQAVAA